MPRGLRPLDVPGDWWQDDEGVWWPPAVTSGRSLSSNEEAAMSWCHHVQAVTALPCKVYISGGKGRIEFDVDDLAKALGLTTEEATAWVAKNL